MNICGRLSDFARLGKIWATKNLVSKLTPAERELIDYGVSRAGFDQELFVSNSYAQVSTLLNNDDPRSLKLSDISSSVVTEIRAAK
jgi:adenylate cyclase